MPFIPLPGSVTASREPAMSRLSAIMRKVRGVQPIPQGASSVDAIRQARPIDKYRDHKSGLTEAEFRRRCRGQIIWHSVDLGDLFVEGKRKGSARLAEENALMDWPDLRGKTVLDIGAFGGWFSFEAERRGAAA